MKPFIAIALLAVPAITEAQGAGKVGPNYIDSLMFVVSVRAGCAEKLYEPIAFAQFEAVRLIELLYRGKEADDRRGFVDRLFQATVQNGGCASFDADSLSVLAGTIRARRDSSRLRAIISSFANLKWGASEQAVVAEHGPPDTRKADSVLRYVDLAYGDKEVLQRKAVLLLRVHEDWGLVFGGYSFQLGAGEDCQAVYNSVRAAVQGRFPSLRATYDRRVNSSTALGICEAIGIGRGELAYSVRDSIGGGQVEVVVNDGRSLVLRSESSEGARLAQMIRFLAARRAF